MTSSPLKRKLYIEIKDYLTGINKINIDFENSYNFRLSKYEDMNKKNQHVRKAALGKSSVYYLELD